MDFRRIPPAVIRLWFFGRSKNHGCRPSHTHLMSRIAIPYIPIQSNLARNGWWLGVPYTEVGKELIYPVS